MHVGSAPREEGMEWQKERHHAKSVCKINYKDKKITFLHFLKKITAVSID